MNINAVNDTTIAYNAIPSSTIDDQQDNLAPNTEEPSQSVGQAAEEAIDTVELSNGDKVRAKGVLRKLQEGHYKGVADVRLRINFHEEISAMEQAEAARIADEGVAGLTDFVNSEIESLLQSGELDEQTAAVVAEAQEIFNSDLSMTGEGAISQLQSGFDQFAASLNIAFTPAAEPIPDDSSDLTSPPVETDVSPLKAALPEQEIPTEIAEEIESFDHEQFLADLIDTFASRMTELQASLDNIQVLPELSEPRGKGGAYDKFLAMYNQLNGIAENQTPPETIDAIM
jgi:hypothetical protein